MDMISEVTIGVPDAAPVTQTTPIAEPIKQSTPVVATPSIEPEKKAPQPSSADLKKAIELKKEQENAKATQAVAPKVEEPKTTPIVREGEAPKEEEWFDKERGFKTKDDFINSYKNSQERMRQQSEQLKAIDAELQAIRSRETAKTMSPEDRQRMEQIEAWKKDNKPALDLIKEEVKRDLDREQSVKDFERMSKQEMTEYKQKLDADPERSKLWPTMGEIYKKEVIMDDRGQPIFKGFLQNPLKYFEAVAFKEKFPEIAESIRQNAVEQYKKTQKEAAEAARSSTTALPGGPKSTGEVDVSKMSSKEIASMLPRKED